MFISTTTDEKKRKKEWETNQHLLKAEQSDLKVAT